MRFSTLIMLALTSSSAVLAVTDRSARFNSIEKDTRGSRTPSECRDCVVSDGDFISQCRDCVIDFLKSSYDEIKNPPEHQHSGLQKPLKTSHEADIVLLETSTECRPCVREFLQEAYEKLGKEHETEVANTSPVQKEPHFGTQKGETCFSYSDCGDCGFYQRCCYKSKCETNKDGLGVCACGVNDKPSGTCW